MVRVYTKNLNTSDGKLKRCERHKYKRELQCYKKSVDIINTCIQNNLCILSVLKISRFRTCR